MTRKGIQTHASTTTTTRPPRPAPRGERRQEEAHSHVTSRRAAALSWANAQA